MGVQLGKGGREAAPGKEAPEEGPWWTRDETALTPARAMPGRRVGTGRPGLGWAGPALGEAAEEQDPWGQAAQTPSAEATAWAPRSMAWGCQPTGLWPPWTGAPGLQDQTLGGRCSAGSGGQQSGRPGDPAPQPQPGDRAGLTDPHVHGDGRGSEGREKGEGDATRAAGGEELWPRLCPWAALGPEASPSSQRRGCRANPGPELSPGACSVVHAHRSPRARSLGAGPELVRLMPGERLIPLPLARPTRRPQAVG